MPSKDSIKATLQRASEQLEEVSDSAFLDAELLLAHCLDKNRSYLHTWPEKVLDTTQQDQFNSLIKKRLTDYPVAYLLGKKAFWTLDLIVTPDVLIPRPETELLVETALEKIQDITNPKILDLGTGSGAIALALASERPDAIILATDFSERALVVAKQNAVELNLDQQVSFIKSNWLDDIDVSKEYFDLIVSNPPYIDPEDSHLQETIRHEPQQALVANNKGLEDIETIIKDARIFSKKGAWLILEHGFDQSPQTLEYFIKSNYSKPESHKDLNGILRISLGKNSDYN